MAAIALTLISSIAPKARTSITGPKQKLKSRRCAVTLFSAGGRRFPPDLSRLGGEIDEILSIAAQYIKLISIMGTRTLDHFQCGPRASKPRYVLERTQCTGARQFHALKIISLIHISEPTRQAEISYA